MDTSTTASPKLPVATNAVSPSEIALGPWTTTSMASPESGREPTTPVATATPSSGLRPFPDFGKIRYAIAVAIDQADVSADDLLGLVDQEIAVAIQEGVDVGVEGIGIWVPWPDASVTKLVSPIELVRAS